MAATPQYAGTPKNGSVQISVANINRDGTGTLSPVFTAGSSGSRIDALVIHATGTTTAGMIRFFLSNDGGVTKRLINETTVSAITPSATIAAFSTTVTSGFMAKGLVMQANAILYASTHNAEVFNVIPMIAGDF